jgi:hypothetical protein
MAHAAFGLINSTPHSAFLSEPEMSALLAGMASSALGLRLPTEGPSARAGASA